MKKLLLLLIIPFLSFGQTPITQENIYQAVDEWLVDPVLTEETYGHISDWDVSNVLSMHYMFAGNTSFNQDLINWDVENVVQCEYFCNGGVNWTLPKPNFTNCPDDTNCN